MSIRRTTKKTAYALGFILAFTLIAALLIVPRLPLRTNPATTVPPQPVAIAVESVDAIVHADSVDIVARLRNTNARAGIAAYKVIFALLDNNGVEIGQVEKNTYILPGSLNYVVALDVPLTAVLSRVTVKTPDQPFFTVIPETLALPHFTSFLQERNTQVIGDNNLEVQTGVINNVGSLGFARVDITGVAFDAEGAVVGVGQTFIDDLDVGQQSEFALRWPIPATPTQHVFVLPDTNIFRSDNILRPEGDPALLR